MTYPRDNATERWGLSERNAAYERIENQRIEIERLRAIETAAKALRNRLKAVHDDPAFKSVWTVNQLHSGPYRGMTYTAALADLDAALQR